MSTSAVTVGGIVKPDGTVEVSEKVNLPAGKLVVHAKGGVRIDETAIFGAAEGD